MKKTNLMMLGGLLAGSAAVWAVTSGPIAGLVDSRKAIEKQPIEKIIPIGTSEFSNLPEAGYYTVPFFFGPTTQAEFDECYCPPAECGKQYTFDSTEKALKANYTPSGTDCDYWAFLPGVKMTPGIYKFSVEYKTKNYNENFAMFLCESKDVNAEHTPLLVIENYKNQNYVTSVVTFNVDNEGIYYIGLHHYSDPNMFNVYIRNFSIEKVDNSKPEIPQITSYDFVDGVGSLTIAAPSTDLSGEALPNELSLHLLIDGEAIEGSPFSVTPGQELVVNMTLQKGNHQFDAYVTALIDGEEKSSEMFSEIHRITKLVVVPAPIPAHFDCDEDELEYCDVINANNDTSFWKFNETGVLSIPGYQYPYNSSSAADDYIVFPALDCNQEGLYEVTFDLATKSDKENVNVFWVSDPSLESLREATPILDLPNVSHFDIWKQYKARVPVSTPGQYYLVIHAYSGAYKGFIYLSNVNVVLGDERQIAQPSFGDVNFEGGDGTIDVNLPATTLVNTPLGDVTIEGNIKEGTVLLASFTGTPGETVSVPITDMALGTHEVTLEIRYTYNGTTYYSDLISTSFQIMRHPSFAYQIPFDMSLKGTDLAYDIQVYDVNQDNKTFSATTDGIKYGYHSTNNADDWVIFLPMDVTSVEDPLEITMSAKSSKSYGELFSVWVGTDDTIESMTYEVIPETEIKTEVVTDFVGQVSLPAPGKYRIGVHCTSLKNMLSLYLVNLKVKYAIDDSLFPQPVSDLVVTADPTGALTANVSFTMPTQTVNETLMAEDVELTATVTCGTNTATFTGAPGAEIEGTIQASEGQNTVTVTVANAEGTSEIVETTVRCGLDIPVTPAFTNAIINETGTGVELTWDPVTTGVNGGIINPELLQYRITPWDEDDQDWDYTESIYTSDTHCVFDAYPNAPQRYVTIGIEAFQNASTNSSVGSIEVVMGKPLEMDVTDDFANQQFNAGIIYAISGGASTAPSWYLSNGQWDSLGDAYDPDNYMLRGSSYSAGAYSLVLFPMISSQNVGSAEVTFEYWNCPNTANLEGVMATYGQDREILGSFPAYSEEETAGWKTYSFTIPEGYMGRPWIQPGIFASFNGTTATKAFINSYSVVATSVVGTREVIASNISVAGIRGNILIGGVTGQNVIVSDLSGKVLFSNTAEGPLTIPAQKGVYVVKAGEKTFKVTVK